jgi:hypothetical protein
VTQLLLLLLLLLLVLVQLLVLLGLLAVWPVCRATMAVAVGVVAYASSIAAAETHLLRRVATCVLLQ